MYLLIAISASVGFIMGIVDSDWKVMSWSFTTMGLALEAHRAEQRERNLNAEIKKLKVARKIDSVLQAKLASQRLVDVLRKAGGG